MISDSSILGLLVKAKGLLDFATFNLRTQVSMECCSRSLVYDNLVYVLNGFPFINAYPEDITIEWFKYCNFSQRSVYYRNSILLLDKIQGEVPELTYLPIVIEKLNGVIKIEEELEAEQLSNEPKWTMSIIRKYSQSIAYSIAQSEGLDQEQTSQLYSDLLAATSTYDNTVKIIGK